MLPAAEHRRITSLLQRLGCNERETEIYLQCLQMDPSSVQEIARRMGSNRFTIHSAVEQLIRKGLLFETRRGKRRLIGAEEPSVLFKLIERKAGDVEQLKVNAEYAVKLLTGLLPESQGKPGVRFYEGVEGYKRMLDETVSARGEVLIFSYVPLLAGLVGPDTLEGYFRKRARKGIATRLLFPPCAFADRIMAKGKEYRSNVRLLPPSLHWASGIFAWNDNVALLSYTKNRLTCTIIENKDIADFYRRIIFELCWAQASSASQKIDSRNIRINDDDPTDPSSSKGDDGKPHAQDGEEDVDEHDGVTSANETSGLPAFDPAIDGDDPRDDDDHRRNDAASEEIGEIHGITCQGGGASAWR